MDRIVPIFIISHGTLASSIKETAKLIIEMRDDIYCLELKEEESLEDFKCRLEKSILSLKDSNDEIIRLLIIECMDSINSIVAIIIYCYIASSRQRKE